MRRTLNHNVLTRAVEGKPTTSLYVHTGNKGINYKFLEVIKDADTIGGVIKAGELVCVKFNAGVPVTTPDGENIIVINEGEILFIN